MKTLIYIKDKVGGFELPLKDIINDIGDLGSNYIWSILELEAIGDLGDLGETYAKIDNAIQGPNGYCVSWNELRNLSHKFEQVINAVIVASEDKESLSTHKTDRDNILKKFPLVVSIMDNDFWEVCTTNEDLINRIRDKYKNIEIKMI